MSCPVLVVRVDQARQRIGNALAAQLKVESPETRDFRRSAKMQPGHQETKMVIKTPFIRAALQAAIVALAISGGSVPAFAHARLLSVDPAPAAAEKPPGTELRLSFSEGIELSFSKVTILDAGQKEIAHGELALDPADDKIVVVTLPDRLPPGHYTIKWSVVSSDGHKAAGSQDYDRPE